MSNSDSINDILEIEKPMEAVVECTSGTKSDQREEVTCKGNDEYVKPKRCRKGSVSNTTERTSRAPELEVEPEKGKRQKQRM